MACIEDELGLIPHWTPPSKPESQQWLVTSHYFASYVRRVTASDVANSTEDSTENGATALVAVVNRYVPKSDALRNPHEGGLTLLLAHSLGLHKEIWEPVLNYLLKLDEKSECERLISEIWSFEPLHHGDAAMINRNGIGEFSSMNIPVDLVEFIRRRMPEEWDPRSVLTTHLPRHEAFLRPNVVGIGHSIGGTSFVHANLQVPKALSSLIIIEPFLVSPEKNIPKAYAMVSAGTARQPEKFSSREALLKYMKKNPTYSDWDAQAVDIYLKYGTFVDEDGQICLKTKRSTEAKLMLNSYMFEAIWFCLPSMPAHVHFIYGNYSWIMSEHSRAQTRVQPPLSSSSDLDAGHATIQEAPQTVASEIFRFLVQRYGSAKYRNRNSAKL